MSNTALNEIVAPRPVTILVEIKDDKNYSIATKDLETIASQLRGKRSFSVFNSIVLPIGITVLTAFLTTLVAQSFQYVSWRNSTAVQETQSRVTRATAAYEKAAAAIAQRSYSTLLFLDAVNDLSNRKEDVDSHLYQLDLALNKRRFDRYYDQLQSWNEADGQMLGEIDFGLDRPIGIAELVRQADIRKINCNQSLTEQLQLHGLNVHSLKLQLGAIKHCFVGVLGEFSKAKDKAIIDKAYSIDAATESKAHAALDDVLTMANEFRCYALNRIEFLKLRLGRSIYVPAWIGWLRETNEQREARARKLHFEQTAKNCKFY